MPTENARAEGAAYVENELKYRVFSYKKDDFENPSFRDTWADRNFTTGSTVRGKFLRILPWEPGTRPTRSEGGKSKNAPPQKRDFDVHTHKNARVTGQNRK